MWKGIDFLWTYKIIYELLMWKHWIKWLGNRLKLIIIGKCSKSYFIIQEFIIRLFIIIWMERWIQFIKLKACIEKYKPFYKSWLNGSILW